MSVSVVASCTYSTPDQASQPADTLTPVVHLRIKVKEVLAEVLDSSDTRKFWILRETYCHWRNSLQSRHGQTAIILFFTPYGQSNKVAA